MASSAREPRAGVSPVMIGRVGALTRLAALVAGAEVGSGDEPAVALVSGEAGIGKTRLVSELIRGGGDGEAVPAHVVVLGCRPGSENRPLDLFTTLHEQTDDGEVATERAVLDHIAGLCADGSTVVVVDDVHWIDTDSAAVVDEMSRRPWSSLVLVVTYRSGVLRRGSPGGELVARLERRAIERVRLERLERNEVGSLIEAITAEQPSSALVDAITHRSDGNPFVVEELTRALLRAHTDAAADADLVSSVELPWSLGDAVRQQLSGLSDRERRTVEAIAILDDATSFDTIAAVAELDPDDLVAALRELVSAGIAEEVGDDTFALAHALMGDAIAQQLLGRERRRLHENALDALRRECEARGEDADDAALLRHAVGAGRYDEVLSLARSGAREAFDGGRTFLALRLAAQGLDEAPDDAELLAIATDAAWRLEFLDEATETAERWVGVATGRDRVNALQHEGRVSFERADFDRAEAAIDRLLSIADDSDEDRGTRAAAAASLAHLYMFSHRSEDSIRWGARARAEATELGDALTAARGRMERAIVLSFTPDAVDGIMELRAAIADARAVGDPVILARGIGNLLNVVSPQSAEALHLLDELSSLSRRYGFDKMGIVVSRRRCDAAIARGDLGAARQALADLRSSWMQSGSDRWRALTEAVIAAEEGRLADAERSLRPFSDPDTYEAINPPVNDDPQWVPLVWLIVLAFAGDRERGQHVYETIARVRKDWPWQGSDLINLVESALVVGVPPDRVRADLTTVPWLSEPIGITFAKPLIDGMLALAEGREADAIALLEPNLDKEDERLLATTRAGLRMTLARALLANGERAKAEEVARWIVDHDLARWPGVRRDRAEDLLRRLSTSRAASGAASADGSEDGPGGMLTPREREVAILLSEGLTNGGLAERLYISPKTAAVHVSNILAKLGLSSRAEIAAWAVRHLDESRLAS